MQGQPSDCNCPMLLYVKLFVCVRKVSLDDLKQLQPSIGRSAMFTWISLSLIGSSFQCCEIWVQVYMLIILWISFSSVEPIFELWNLPYVVVVVYWIRVEVEQVTSMAWVQLPRCAEKQTWRLLVHVVEINFSDMQVGSVVSCIFCDHFISSNDLMSGKNCILLSSSLSSLLLNLVWETFDLCLNWSNMELFWKNGVLKQVKQNWRALERHLALKVLLH